MTGRRARLAWEHPDAGSLRRLLEGLGIADEVDVSVARPGTGGSRPGGVLRLTADHPGEGRATLGWATVDAERAAAEIGPARAGPGRHALRPLPDDDAVGARATAVLVGGRVALVLLEPATEGRIAASLARHGEGPAVLYVAVDGLESVVARGVRLGPARSGPFGESWLVLGLPPSGPHVVVHAATIER